MPAILVLSSVALPQQAAATQHTGTIGAVPVTISDADPVDEGGTATFTVTLDRAAGFGFTAPVTYTAGSALLTDLGSTRATSITFTPSGTTYTIEVPIVNDDLPEGEETFMVSVETATNPSEFITATGTINASDNTPAAVAPAITTQPTDQSVTVGENATFTVTATGTPTPTYQWSFDGTEISGATSASYTISSAALTNAGDYTVVVTNTAGTVTSSAATLTVTPAAVAPQITTQPTDQSVTVGENATFTVAATGTPAPTYQWHFDGTEISGATSASYTISSAALTNAGDYTVVVTNTAGTVTSTAATLTVTPAAVAPQITTQPTDQSVTVGETATFTVAATGTPAPTYQWHFDGTEISGATSASYAISSVALTNAGDYTVVVTNTAGEVTSTAATLTVTAATVAPQITTQPTNQSVTVGETATFTVTATGTPTPTYQWSFDGTEISGATSASYTISSAALTNAGDYTVVVTNTAGTVTSTAATLTVTPAAVAPQITTQPTNQSVTVGENATFTVAATGTPAPTYQWHFDGTEISGATSASYTISSAALTNAGDYTAVVTNTAGTVTSTAATLTVTPAAVAPQITTQPTDQSVTVGETATFTVAATGTPAPTYQWRFDGTEISGATSASYTISSAALTNAGDYTVVVTNTAGTVTSTAATLTVTAAAVAPQITTQPTDQSVTVGENATFTVTATGTPTPSYQWSFDGSDIAGATSASYTISSAASTDAGDYTVVVTNTAGTVTSTAATLTVMPAAVAPQITTQPTDQSVTVGENATFTVTATGTPTPSYQWRFDGSDIAGATSASYTLSNAALTNAGDYTVVVTNTAGTVTSSAATLTVTAAAVAPAITTQPVSQSVTVGENATFTVTATGTPTPSYQWRFAGSDIAGATSASYTLSNAALTNAGDYTVVVTNTAGTVTSSAATLTVTAVVNATVSIAAASALENVSGGNAEFTVSLTTAVAEDVVLAVAYAVGDTNPVVLATDLGTRPTTVTINQGQTSATLLVPIIDDSIVESDETFTVTISEGTTSLPTGVTIGTDATATGTITNDDTAVLGFTGNAFFVAGEGNTITPTVSFLSSGATSAAVDVTLTWTAVPDENQSDPGQPEDLNPSSGTVTIPAGQSSADITITFVDDTDDEPGTEALLIQLGLSTTSPLPPDVSLVDSSNAAYQRGVRIGDNDATSATVSIDNVSVAENVAGGVATFTASLSAKVRSLIRVGVAVTPGDTNPVVLADDLGDLPTMVLIGAGQLSADFTVPILNDEIVEGNETFTVTLREDIPNLGPLPIGVTIPEGDGTATGTIVDDDDPPPPEATVSIGNASVAENDGNAEFTVSLTQAVESDVTVAVAYAAGTATLATDLGTRPTTVTIDEGDTEATLEVPVTNDNIVEGNEDFTVTISEGSTALPEGVTIGTAATGTGTITDNDLAEVTLGPATLEVAENETFTYTVSLSKAADEAVTVRWTATDGTASVDDDLQEQTNTVTFDANDNTAQEFTISPVDDPDDEVNETFTVTLEVDTAGGNPLPTGVTIGTSNSSTATITDNDDPTGPDLTVDDVTVSSASVVEGAAFTINATVNNGGNAASAATTLTWYRSADATITTGDTSIATDPIAILAASGSSTQDASVSIATAGTYYVGACVPTVSGETDTDNNCSTGVQVTVTAAAVAPQITTQPTDQSVTVGETATFTVTATGTPTPTYQWSFDGTEISGATSASYAISSAALTNAGDYTVVVTNTAGTVTSNAATLTVTPVAVAPQITTQPVNQSVTVGGSATFTVTATGTPTPTYQWRFEGSDIAGATSASYTLSSAALTNAGDYTVVVTNTAGTVTSSAATLTVTAATVAPQITTQPTNQSVTVGGSATFTVTATGTPTPTYQWRFEGSDIAGATSASYAISSAALTNAGDYTVVVTNTAGTVTSSAATLTVTPAAVAPAITTQPTDQSVTVGGSATFTVTATGTPTPTYQWRFEGSDIAGATSASYAISSAALTNAGDYTVVVTNTAGTVTSSAATLTVTAATVAPQITTQPTNQSVTVGGSATFTVAATGTPTPTYQWRFEGSDIAGATSASYTLSNAALTNAGDYTVVVTNTAGTVTSTAATLTVTAAPPATAPDLTVGSVSVSSASVVEGTAFTINATVNNGGNGASAATTLTWYRSTDATITTGDTSIGTDAVGALAANGSSPESISVSIATAGTYHVGACVPTVSGETDTDNNCSTGVQVTVTAAAIAPAITTQPTNRSVTVGGSATFTVVATGAPTPTYQWRKDGTAISGATSATYTLSNAALTDAGDYTVVVTNTAGTVTSSAATLTVTAATVAPQITTQPTNQSVTVGENATFTVAATGTPTPTYQWRFEGSDIAGATLASYTISSAALTNAGDYTVVVTNTAGTVTSNAATLTVTPAAVAPQITTQPTDQSVTVGETATFTVTATGTPTPTYQWRFEGSNISGATSASYTISSAALTNAGDYTVVVTNTAGTVTSSAATLTVTAATVAPQITTQPVNQSVTVGATATFTVTATGTPTPTYQWRFEGSDISGATSASYTLSSAALTNAGDYTVVVTNTAGTVTSSAATLTVTAAAVAPQITTQPTNQSVTVGDNATFTVTATGTPTPTYQWRFEGSEISGATSASYTLSNAALTDAGEYAVVVTNTAGTVTSSAATLTVTPAAVAPQITTQPVNQSVTVGDNATFTVTATGTPTPTYQWRFEGSDIAGATSASYTLSSAALTNAGDYTVVVTNTAGTVTSSAATLTVTAAVNATVSIGNASVAENGGNAEFMVSLTTAVSRAVVLDVNFKAEGPNPVTLADDLGTLPTIVTIDQGQTSATLSVPITDDALVEGDETFTVTLSEDNANPLPEGVTIDNREATGTIMDNDEPLIASIEDAQAAEGEMLRFKVTLDRPAHEQFTLRWSTSDGTALAGEDYAAVSDGAVVFALGASTAELAVSSIEDQRIEEDEHFAVVLSTDNAPPSVVVDDSSAVGTIENDDVISVLLEPRRTAAMSALRRHVNRFERVTSSAAHNRLSGRAHGDSFGTSENIGSGDVAKGVDFGGSQWSGWLNSAYAGFAGDSNGEQADLYTGVDYLSASGNLVWGVLLGVESARLDVGQADYESDYLQYGVYAGVRLSEDLIWDGAVSYGTATPEISLDEVYADYDAQRLSIRSELTGTYNLLASGALTVSPQLGILYARERLGSFFDSVGGIGPREVLELGRISAGPRFTWRLPQESELLFGTRFQWDMLRDAEGRETRLSGAVDLGVRFNLTSKTSMGIFLEADGIGNEDEFATYGGRVEINAEF